jgi:hypothetical protein
MMKKKGKSNGKFAAKEIGRMNGHQSNVRIIYKTIININSAFI